MRAHHQLGNIGASAEKQHLKVSFLRTCQSVLILIQNGASRDENKFVNALQTRCSRGRAAFNMLS